MLLIRRLQPRRFPPATSGRPATRHPATVWSRSCGPARRLLRNWRLSRVWGIPQNTAGLAGRKTQRPGMKAISASIIVLAGAHLMQGGFQTPSDFPQILGLVLIVIGLCGWFVDFKDKGSQ